MDKILKDINGRFDVLQGIDEEGISRFSGLLSLAADSGVDFETFYGNFNVGRRVRRFNVHLVERGLPKLNKNEVRIIYERVRGTYSG